MHLSRLDCSLREATRSRFEVRSEMEMMTSCQCTHVAGWARRASGGVSAASNGSGGLASLSPHWSRALCCRMTSSRDGRTWAPSVQCQCVAYTTVPYSLVQCVTIHHVRVAVSVLRRAPTISHRPYGGRPPAAHMSQVSPTSTLHYTLMLKPRRARPVMTLLCNWSRSRELFILQCTGL